MVDTAELTYHFFFKFLNFTLPSKDSIRPPSVRIAAVLPTKPGNPPIQPIKYMKQLQKQELEEQEMYNHACIVFVLH